MRLCTVCGRSFAASFGICRKCGGDVKFELRNRGSDGKGFASRLSPSLGDSSTRDVATCDEHCYPDLVQSNRGAADVVRSCDDAFDSDTSDDAGGAAMPSTNAMDMSIEMHSSSVGDEYFDEDIRGMSLNEDTTGIVSTGMENNFDLLNLRSDGDNNSGGVDGGGAGEGVLDDRTPNITVGYCANCQRYDAGDGSLSLMSVETEVENEVLIGFRQSYCRLRQRGCAERYDLCSSCRIYLVKDSTSGEYAAGHDKWINVWPSYVRLKVLGTIHEGGIGFAWRFLPREWRNWWLPIACGLPGGQELTLDTPQPYFTILRTEREDFDSYKETMRAADLIAYCDTHLSFDVQCPWGCTETSHKVGGVAYDHACKKFLNSSVDLASFDVKGLHKTGRNTKPESFQYSRQCFGARGDYLSRDKVTQEPKVSYILDGMKPLRRVIVMSPSGPMVCTCRRHDGGNSDRYVHVPVNPVSGSVASIHGNQLAPCTVRPNTLRTTKDGSKCTKFRVNKLSGDYNGIDCCYLGSQPRFDQHSSILQREHLLTLRRPDVQENLNHLVSQRLLDSNVARDMLEDAAKFLIGENSRCIRLNDRNHSILMSPSEALCGSTSVSVHSAIEMHRMLGSANVMKHRVLNTVTGQLELVSFAPNFPRRLFPCHPLDLHGEQPPRLRKNFDRREWTKCDGRLVWFLLSAFTSLPRCWKVIYESINNENEWHGYLLATAGKFCLTGYSGSRGRSSGDNPYKKILSPRALLDKLNECNDLDESDEDTECFVEQVKQTLLTVRNLAVIDSSSLEDLDLLPDNDVGLKEVVVACQDYQSDSYPPPPESVSFGNGGSHRLVYVFGSDRPDDNGRWNVRAFSRYDCHDGWWRHFLANEPSRCSSEFSIGDFFGSNLLSSQGEPQHWELAIYLKDVDVDFDVERDNIMSLLGGQTKCRCGQHRFALVHCPNSNDYICCICKEEGGVCGKRGKVQCPFIGCNLIICNDHLKEFASSLAADQVALIPSDGAGMRRIVNAGSLSQAVMAWNEAPESSESDASYENESSMLDFSSSGPWDEDSVGSYDSLGQRQQLHMREGFEGKSDGAPDHAFQGALLRNIDDQSWSSQPSLIHRCNGSVGSYDATHDNEFDDDFDVPGMFDSGDRRLDGHSGVGAETTSEHRVEIEFIPQQIPLHDEDEDSDGFEADDEDTSSAGGTFGDDDGLGGVYLNMGDDDDDDYDDYDNVLFTDASAPAIDFVAAPDLKSQGYFSVKVRVALNNWGRLLYHKYDKLRGTLGQRGFLERIVSTSTGRSLPLLFVEATIFLSIFWYFDSLGPGYVGSLPVSLWSTSGVAKKMAFAGVLDHLICRITNYELICSSNPMYIFWCFDILTNLACRGSDTRLFLKRGFEGLPGGKRGLSTSDGIGSDEGIFPGDTIDSRKTLLQLSAMMRYSLPSFFFTHTCNQSAHFGVWKIREWVERRCREYDQMFDVYSLSEIAEKKKMLKEAMAMELTRCWVEVCELLMDYIINSPEKPLGEIFLHWWRLEFQEDEGNLPHIHALLWVARGSLSAEEFSDFLNRKIVCGSRYMIDDEIIRDLVCHNLIDGNDLVGEKIRLCEGASRFLRHNCKQGSYRCMRRVGRNKDDFKCRSTDFCEVNPHPNDYGFKYINPNYSRDMEELLLATGLATRDNEMGQLEFHEILTSGIFVYPADPEEKAVPCSYFIFAMTGSTTNLLRTNYNQAAQYLTKYLGKIAEGTVIEMYANKPNQVNMSVGEVGLNSKISSNAAHLASAANKREKDHPEKTAGIALPLTEAIVQMLGYSTVHTNATFVLSPTLCLQERPGVIKSGGAPLKLQRGVPVETQVRDVAYGGQLLGAKLREDLNFPAYRQFTDNQKILMADSLFQPLNLDAVTLFGMRPPELLFIERIPNWVQWTVRKKITLPRKARGNRQSNDAVDGVENDNGSSRPDSVSARLLSGEVVNSAFVDGMEFKILFRPAAVPEVLNLLSELVDEGDVSERILHMYRLFTIIFHSLNDSIDTLVDGDYIYESSTSSSSGLMVLEDSVSSCSDERTDANSVNSLAGPCSDWPEWSVWEGRACVISTFVDTTYRLPINPLPIFNAVRPDKSHRFLYHLVLSMGRFSETEREVFSNTSWRAIFATAKMIPVGGDVSEGHVYGLARKYIIEQLAFLPGTKSNLDYYSVEAKNLLMDAIVHDRLPVNDIPSSLYTSLQQECTAEVLAFVSTTKRNMLRVIMKKIPGQNLPTLDQATRASKTQPLDFPCTFQDNMFHPREMMQEKQKAFATIMNSVREYHSMGQKQPHNVLCVGIPGTGKSFVMLKAIVCSACLGLNVFVTAEKAQLAQELGSFHLDRLLCIPVVDESVSAKAWADKAIPKLMRNQRHLFLVRTLDILLIDEIGTVSAKKLSVIDMLCRYARGRNDMFGGILVLGTMDPNQLPTIEGYPFLLATQVLTSFVCATLSESVRHISDPLQKEVCKIMAKENLNQSNVDRFRAILTDPDKGCNFISEEESRNLPPNVMRVFPKRASARKAQDDLVSNLKRGTIVLERFSIDEETMQASSSGSNNAASPGTVAKLDKLSKMVQKLQIFEGAMVQMTYNSKKFTQGQLAMLLDLPTKEALDNFEPVKIFLAPVGTKIGSFQGYSREELESLGWQEISVGKHTDQSWKRVGNGLLGRRSQYPFVLKMSMTIHASMGATLPKLVTSVIKENTL